MSIENQLNKENSPDIQKITLDNNPVLSDYVKSEPELIKLTQQFWKIDSNSKDLVAFITTINKHTILNSSVDWIKNLKDSLNIA